MRSRLLSAALAAVLASAAGASRAAADDQVQALKTALETTQKELATTRADLAQAREAIASLSRRVDSLATTPSSAAAPLGASARIAPVNVDNPGVSFVIDNTFSADTQGSGANFALRGGELFVSAPIDPFLRGYASLHGSSQEGFDIEEAALVTTALPWNLTVKGGRFFADVGRLSSWHDETLPFVDRPPSLDKIIGGESGAEGVEVSWLAPTDLFLQVTGGVYNSIGSARRQALMDTGFNGRRSFGDLTYLVRPLTYVDLTDTWNLEVGGTFAFEPAGNQRKLWGADITLRHQPGTSNFYQGLVVGAEWLWNDENFDNVQLGLDPATGAPLLGSGSFQRSGGYVYSEAFFGRRYSAGLRFDDAEEISGPANRQQTYSVFATWKPSEFHRLRLQLDEVTGGLESDNQRVTLQWTAFIGSHSHGFRVR